MSKNEFILFSKMLACVLVLIGAVVGVVWAGETLCSSHEVHDCRGDLWYRSHVSYGVENYPGTYAVYACGHTYSVKTRVHPLSDLFVPPPSECCQCGARIVEVRRQVGMPQSSSAPPIPRAEQ